jgi:prepilin-type N-terminal cleavage/methylation domain-containing protein
MRKSRSAFTLVELLVVIMIIAALVGLLLPSMCCGSRETFRRTQCTNNLKQLSIAIQMYESSRGDIPGYINDIGNEKNRARASWAALSIPYLESNDIYDSWASGKPKYACTTMFICPSDPQEDLSAPALSYVANAGYISDADDGENAHNGLFLDLTRTAEGAAGPSDERDDAKLPLQKMSLKYLQSKGDGTARTLMFSENLNALHWGYTLDKDRDETKDRSYHFGFCWEQPSEIAKAEAKETAKRYRRINSRYPEEEIKSFAQMTSDDGFPSSNHPEIVNVAFASGSVQAMNQDIDPLVYAQLMTSNHELSDLRDVDGKAEKELKEPVEGDW